MTEIKRYTHDASGLIFNPLLFIRSVTLNLSLGFARAKSASLLSPFSSAIILYIEICDFKFVYWFSRGLNLQAIHLLFHLLPLYIANSMAPDQTAPYGHSLISGYKGEKCSMQTMSVDNI